MIFASSYLFMFNENAIVDDACYVERTIEKASS